MSSGLRPLSPAPACAATVYNVVASRLQINPLSVFIHSCLASTEHSLSSDTGWHNPLQGQLQDMSLAMCWRVGWGGSCRKEKKEVSVRRWGGALLPFRGRGGLKVARKLTSCPAMAAAAATSHPGWGAVSGPQRAWGEIISGSQPSSTFL